MPPDSLLEEVMPDYDVHEFHEVWVEAPAEDVYEAARAASPRDMPLLVPLIALRALPALLRRRPLAGASLSTPVLDQALQNGFVVLAERPGSEIVAGAVGRFWSVSGNQPLTSIRGRDDFLAFADPGYAKAAMNLRVVPEGGGARLTTETRIKGTDPGAVSSFSRYWFAIGWASAAIRRSWLRGVRRKLTEG